MTLTPIAGLRFTDAQSNEEIYVSIRAAQGRVALGLSLKESSDIEVVLSLDSCEQLVNELQQALAIARGE